MSTNLDHKPDCGWYGIAQDDLTDDELDSLDDMPCNCFNQLTAAEYAELAAIAHPSLNVQLVDVATTSLKSPSDAQR